MGRRAFIGSVAEGVLALPLAARAVAFVVTADPFFNSWRDRLAFAVCDGYRPVGERAGTHPRRIVSDAGRADRRASYELCG